MKKLMTTFLASIGLILLNAQTTITNGDMESWTGSGATMEPAQWNSNKTGGGNATTGPQTCFKETNSPHGGAACAKVATGNIIGIVVNGSLTTGRVEAPSFNKSEGYIHSKASDPNFRMSFTGRPDSLVFWYKYTPAGTDYPTVEARLHVGNAYAPEAPQGGNHPDSTVNIIARAEWQGASATVANWTRVSVPFVYVDGRTPQYIFITATSTGNQTGGTSGSTLWLDDFDAIYNPTIATGTITPLTYYVSADAGASIEVPYTLNGTFDGSNVVTVQLSDTGGSFASPIAIGSAVSASSGTISALIPAATAPGSGYKVRVVSSNPALTAANAVSISVVYCATAIAPTAGQTIVAHSNGNSLSVSETPAASSREWKYATTSGGAYIAFGTPQTGTAYTPNFSTPGTYYVVCESHYPVSGQTPLTVRSNEVVIHVVGNSISPAATQSILVGTNGSVLTVTESPSGTAREWKYAQASGGPYLAFAPAQTDTTYTPNFATAGNYYVVCQSLIGGLTATSNEVLVSVNSVTLSTGTISGSPFAFSPSAPDAVLSVPYTVSSAFAAGNVFTVQLSDATGSFTSPLPLGTQASTTSGTVAATIPSNTLAGTGYRIRVVASNPQVIGTDNGVDLTIDQFHNAVTPAVAQQLAHSTNGNTLSVAASQSSTQEWQYATQSGGTYTSFNPAETAASYTPNFALPGTYFVICKSVNQYGDTAVSNEVRIEVSNGSTLTTAALSGAPFETSASAHVQVQVAFTSDAVFQPGNVFKVQLSDAFGNFSNPTEIGTENGATIAPITAVIPNSAPAGSAYRIRVVSTDPALVGSDNGTDLQIIPFEASVAPADSQWILQGNDGMVLTATATQACTYQWQYSEISGLAYVGFTPAETNASYTPHFNAPKTYYVVCKMTNGLNDELLSQEVVVVVDATIGIEHIEDKTLVYAQKQAVVVDLRSSLMKQPILQLVNLNGQVVVEQKLTTGALNTVAVQATEGIYLFRLLQGDKITAGRLLLR